MTHADEPFAGLPNGWIWTNLECVSEKINPGFPTGKHNKQNIGIPHIRPMNISVKGEIDLSNVKYIEVLDYEPLLKGDVLFNNTNSPEMLGKTTFLRQDTNWAYSNHMTRIRLFRQFLEPAWVAYYLHYLFLRGFFKMNCVHHVNQASINTRFLSQKVQIPLPPLSEQHRIVAKIEELFSHLDAGVEALQKAKAQLKRYRQAVLKAAVEGKLTEEWRKQHPDVEPAEKVIEEIYNKGDRGKRRSSISKEYSLSNLPKLPDTWMWVSIDQVSDLITDGDHNPPKRTTNGIPHLTAKNIKNWRISEDGCTYINKTDFELVRKRYSPQANDVVITCVGTVGRTALVPEGYTFSADRNLAAVRLASNCMEPRFLQYNLNTSASQKAILGASGSTAQPHFYLGDIRTFPVAIAPIEEQQSIITEIENRFLILDELDVQIEVSIKYSNNLRKSILKRAFEGKLVPQDPNDEPASVLLERIKAERIKQPSAKKLTRKSLSKVTTLNQFPD